MNLPRAEAREQKRKNRKRIAVEAALLGDHDRLEQLYTRLLDACRADAREDAALLWSELDRRLSRHLVFEERVLFPELAKADPYEVDALMRDHAEIRKLAGELCVEVDLHVLRLSRADAFLELLRAHAKREDALLYRWAETHLTGDSALEARRFVHALDARR